MAARDSLRGFARHMEALGDDSLWTSDHVIEPDRVERRYPYRSRARPRTSSRSPSAEPVQSFGKTIRQPRSRTIAASARSSPIWRGSTRPDLSRHLAGCRDRDLWHLWGMAVDE